MRQQDEDEDEDEDEDDDEEEEDEEEEADAKVCDACAFCSWHWQLRSLCLGGWRRLSLLILSGLRRR